MKSTLFWTLLTINVALLAMLLSPHLRGSEAVAQRAGGARRPDVMMIPGDTVGQSSAIVYLIDTKNQQLAAISLNGNGNGIDSLEPQPLDRVFEDRGGPAGETPKTGKTGKTAKH
jgi:hypothetical protein